MKRILDHLRTGLCWEVNHFFVKMRKFLLIILGVILIALVNVTAANSEEQTNPGSELNSRELRGAERKENGQKRSKKKKNKKKKRRQRKKNRKRKGRKGQWFGMKEFDKQCSCFYSINLKMHMIVENRCLFDHETFDCFPRWGLRNMTSQSTTHFFSPPDI